MNDDQSERAAQPEATSDTAPTEQTEPTAATEQPAPVAGEPREAAAPAEPSPAAPPSEPSQPAAPAEPETRAAEATGPAAPAEPEAKAPEAAEPTAAAAPSAEAATATETAAPAPAAAANDDDDAAQEVEPESIEPRAPKPKAHTHHPPPPPSLRSKSSRPPASGEEALIPEPRFTIAGKPRLARDLMTRKLFTIGPDDTLENLEEHMQSFRFRHLPVVDGDKLVGLITHRDLLHASSSFLSERAKERDEIIHKLPASRIMHRDLVTARPETPLEEIAALMWRKKIGCVLVTDAAGMLVGIVTEADFIRLAHHFLVQQPAS